MRHIVFVAPRFLDNTNRYLKAFAELDNVTLSVISLDPESAIPAAIHPRIAGHYGVKSLDTAELTAATRWLASTIGRVDRLVGFLEELQVPLAEVRDALDIEGLRTQTAHNFRDKDQMKTVLRAAGVPVARSTLAATRAELDAFIA